jgi:hypothetical protein
MGPLSIKSKEDGNGKDVAAVGSGGGGAARGVLSTRQHALVLLGLGLGTLMEW